MAHLPLWLSLALLLVWLIAPGVITFQLLRRYHSLPLQLTSAVVASVVCFVGPWLPDFWLAQHAAAMCLSAPPYTITRAPVDATETPVPFPEREELDYGLARNKVTYKSVRTGEVLATTSSWRIAFTPVVTTVLGLNPQQRFALMDAILPPGCSFDSPRPLPGTDTTVQKRFWLEAFKPKDMALPELPDVALTELGKLYPPIALAPNLPTLQQAVSRDPKIHGLILSLMARSGIQVSDTERAKMRDQLREFYWRMAGTDKLDPKSRGHYIDARDLGVMERVNGATYWGIGGPNPNETAGPMLNGALGEILNGTLDKLAAKRPAP